MARSYFYLATKPSLTGNPTEKKTNNKVTQLYIFFYTYTYICMCVCVCSYLSLWCNSSQFCVQLPAKCINSACCYSAKIEMDLWRNEQFPSGRIGNLQGRWWLTCHQSLQSSTNLKPCGRLRKLGKHQVSFDSLL